METKITITHDPHNHYGEGTTIKAETMFTDYTEKCEKSLRDWYWRIPFAVAIGMIAHSLDITFKYA